MNILIGIFLIALAYSVTSETLGSEEHPLKYRDPGRFITEPSVRAEDENKDGKGTTNASGVSLDYDEDVDGEENAMPNNGEAMFGDSKPEDKVETTVVTEGVEGEYYPGADEIIFEQTFDVDDKNAGNVADGSKSISNGLSESEQTEYHRRLDECITKMRGQSNIKQLLVNQQLTELTYNDKCVIECFFYDNFLVDVSTQILNMTRLVKTINPTNVSLDPVIAECNQRLPVDCDIAYNIYKCFADKGATIFFKNYGRKSK